MKGSDKDEIQTTNQSQKNEFVQAQVHQENDFTKELKDFVLINGNSNQLLVYDDKDAIILSLDDIALITIIDDKERTLSHEGVLLDLTTKNATHSGSAKHHRVS